MASPFEFLWLVKESAYMTPMASPAAGVDSIYIRLAGPNRFTMRPKPIRKKVPFGGGFAANGYVKSDKIEIKGALQVELCASQTAFLLGWLGVRINNAQTAPWVTTEPIGDLASVAIYHGIARSDGSIKRRSYLGTKGDGWGIKCSEDDFVAMLTANLTAATMTGDAYNSTSDPTSGAFAAPADTAFPIDPWLFLHTAGAYLIGGANVATLRSMDWETKNVLFGNFYNNPYLQYYHLRGRQTTLQQTTTYTASPDWRSQFEAIAALAGQVTFNNGTHTLVLNANAQNVIDDLSDDLQPGQVYAQDFTLENQWDPAAGSDIVVSYT